MSENVSGDPAVLDTGAAVPNSTATENTDNSELQRLKTKLELVQQDKLRAGETNSRLNTKIQELEDTVKGLTAQIKSGEQQQLEGSGEYQKLWEQSKETNRALERRISELETELDAERQAHKTQALRTKALQEISDAKAVRPDQLLSLIATDLREDASGKPVVLDGGMEIPLRDHLARLRSPESGWDHHFAANGAVGMGAKPSAVGSAYGGPNPFRLETRNLTEQSRLYQEDPALYQRLKAEAARG